MRVTLVAVTLVALLLAGCAQSPAPGTSAPTHVTVGTEAKYPPFEDTVDGKIVGFDIDLMREVAKRAGFDVTFQNAVFDDIIPSVQTGQFDVGASAFTITDDRKQQVDFSVPYYENELMVAVASGTTDVKTEQDISGNGVKVCTQKGTTSYDWLKAHGHENSSLILLEDFPTCGQAVLRGDAKATMIDRAAVRDLVGKSNGALKEAFTIPTDEKFGFAVAKGKSALLDAINKALAAMKADGTVQRLQDQWKA